MKRKIHLRFCICISAMLHVFVRSFTLSRVQPFFYSLILSHSAVYLTCIHHDAWSLACIAISVKLFSLCFGSVRRISSVVARRLSSGNVNALSSAYAMEFTQRSRQRLLCRRLTILVHARSFEMVAFSLFSKSKQDRWLTFVCSFIATKCILQCNTWDCRLSQAQFILFRFTVPTFSFSLFSTIFFLFFTCGWKLSSRVCVCVLVALISFSSFRFSLASLRKLRSLEFFFLFLFVLEKLFNYFFVVAAERHSHCRQPNLSLTSKKGWNYRSRSHRPWERAINEKVFFHLFLIIFTYAKVSVRKRECISVIYSIFDE